MIMEKYQDSRLGLGQHDAQFDLVLIWGARPGGYHRSDVIVGAGDFIRGTSAARSQLRPQQLLHP